MKEVEIEELGIIIKSSITEIEEQRTALAFVDDTSFFDNRTNYKRKVQ